MATWGVGIYPGVKVGQHFNMTLQDVIDYGYDLGMTDYPIFDEDYRETLNALIIDHFRLREIRGETPKMFIWYLNRQLNENMSVANVMFQALKDKTFEDFLKETDYTTTYEQDVKGTSDSTSKTTSDTTSKSQAYASTNPRQTMDGENVPDYYDSGTFSTSDSQGVTDATGTTGSTTDTDATTHMTGYGNKDYMSTINGFFTGANNALQVVFDIVEPCFVQMWTDHHNVMF